MAYTYIHRVRLVTFGLVQLLSAGGCSRPAGSCSSVEGSDWLIFNSNFGTQMSACFLIQFLAPNGCVLTPDLMCTQQFKHVILHYYNHNNKLCK